jgi:hypothetical protein
MREQLSKIWTAAISTWWTFLPKDERDYRPEAHYMRGPGPKWRAKHVAATGQQ